MRALFASPLGFLIGLSLGTLGGGGSILAVPVLVYAAGQDPRSATATSLVLVGTAAVAGLGAHWRAGRVRAGTGLSFGLAGIGGSVGGSALNRHVDPDLLLLGFSVLVLAAAWRMGIQTGRDGPAAAAPPPPGETSAAGLATLVAPAIGTSKAMRILLVGSAVGFLTGLFGVGGGFVIVPALVLALGLPMREAVGTSLLVISINSAVALISRLATTSIDWSVTVPFTVAALAGVAAGGAVAERLDASRAARWFAGLLVVVALYTAVRAASGLG